MTTQLTPQQVAAFNIRLTGGRCDHDAIGRRFAEQAAVYDDYAELAGSAGRYQGFSRNEALRLAADLRERAVLVPAYIRDLLAAGGAL